MPQESASQLFPRNNAILIEARFSDSSVGFSDLQAARKGLAGSLGLCNLPFSLAFLGSVSYFTPASG